MGPTGKRIRSRHIFKQDGKTLIVSMDHGPTMGPVKGLEDLKATLKQVLSGEYKPDAVLLTPAMINLCYGELAGKVGIAARIDGGATIQGPDITDFRLYSSVEEALAVGADAVATMAFIGVEKESDCLEKVGMVSQECGAWGMPHIVEALSSDIIAHHFKREAEFRWPNPENVKFAVRVAAELGADIVKSYYTGNPDSFREVVRCCPVPIIVLSGPGAKNPEGLLRAIREMTDAGAKGVIMGRNIWGHRNPPAMVEAIAKIIHEDESVEKALKIISK